MPQHLALDRELASALGAFELLLAMHANKVHLERVEGWQRAFTVANGPVVLALGSGAVVFARALIAQFLRFGACNRLEFGIALERQAFLMLRLHQTQLVHFGQVKMQRRFVREFGVAVRYRARDFVEDLTVVLHEFERGRYGGTFVSVRLEFFTVVVSALAFRCAHFRRFFEAVL